MQIPAAMFIESTLDGEKKNVRPDILEDQEKELTSAVGADKAKELGIKFPLSEEFILGYFLGLQVARTMIATNVTLRLKGIDPKDIL